MKNTVYLSTIQNFEELKTHMTSAIPFVTEAIFESMWDETQCWLNISAQQKNLFIEIYWLEKYI